MKEIFIHIIACFVKGLLATIILGCFVLIPLTIGSTVTSSIFFAWLLGFIFLVVAIPSLLILVAFISGLLFN
jgi:hypothetical protein